MRKKEVSRRVTMLGPHRDDIHVQIRRDGCQYILVHKVSNGQSALSLKLAEIEYIYQKIGFIPFFYWMMYYQSWMISAKTTCFGRFEGRVQTFVTTTGLDGIDSEWIRKSKVYHIQARNYY